MAITTQRTYSSRRMGIVKALTELLKNINGSGDYQSDVENRVLDRLVFWDEISEFPTICINAGPESRVYLGAGHKDRYLTATIRIYVKDEDAAYELEAFIEDVETLLEQNCRLAYKDRLGNTQYTQLISVLSIDTDEGVLSPLGIGELICEIRY